MLQSPSFTKAMAKRGMSTPAYAYAANNPIAFVDPDGRWIRSVTPSLRRYIDLARQTPAGKRLLGRLDAAPNPVDITSKADVLNGGTTKNACGPSPITINVVTKGREGKEFTIMKDVGHELTHGAEATWEPDGFVRSEADWWNGEVNAERNGWDIASDVFSYSVP